MNKVNILIDKLLLGIFMLKIDIKLNIFCLVLWQLTIDKKLSRVAQTSICLNLGSVTNTTNITTICHLLLCSFTPDTPENCHLNVKIDIFSKKLTKIVFFSKKLAMAKNDNFCQSFSKNVNFLTFKWQFSGGSDSHRLVLDHTI